MKENEASFARWLKAQKKTLIVSHTKPDGDAFGSLYGLTSAFNDNNIPAVGYMGVKLPNRYKKFFPHLSNVYLTADPPLDDIASIICLDTATKDRLELPEGMHKNLYQLTACNIDHHADNSRYGAVNIVENTAAATAQIITGILDEMQLHISPATATCLLTGLIMDCGGFRFNNTDENVLQTAITLMRHGAELPKVMDHMFFQQPYNLLLLKSELFQKTSFEHNGKFAYITLPSNKLEEYGLSPQETEGIIDGIRSIDGVIIAAMLYKKENVTRVSLRSSSAQYPVAPIARELGGGGHDLAAAASLGKISMANAKHILIQKTGDILNK